MFDLRWHMRFALGLCLATAVILCGGCWKEDPNDPTVYISGAYYYSANDPKKPADAKPYRKSVVVAQGYAAAPLPQAAPKPSPARVMPSTPAAAPGQAPAPGAPVPAAQKGRGGKKRGTALGQVVPPPAPAASPKGRGAGRTAFQGAPSSQAPSAHKTVYIPKVSVAGQQQLYHSKNCDQLPKVHTAISEKEALRRHYKPCPKCHP